MYFSYRSQNDPSYQIPKEILAVQEAFISPVHGYKVSGSGSTYGLRSPPIGMSYSSSNSYNSAPASVYEAFGGGHHGRENLGGSNYGGNTYGGGNTYNINKGYGNSNGYGSFPKTYTTSRPHTNIYSNELQSSSSSVEQQQLVCTKKPKKIMNAAVRCTLLTNTCKAVCTEGYQFPTGETLLHVICEAGEWSLEKYEWSDQLSCEREHF